MPERYARQMELPGWTPEKQERLTSGRVLVVGAGGLGSAVLPYLVAAGIGCAGIVDADSVDLTNLQRQVLYDMNDIGTPKVEAATRRLRALNPDVEIQGYRAHLEPHNAVKIITDYNLIVDCTDHLETRKLLNRTCLDLGKPWVHAAVSEYYGHVTTLLPSGPCWYCLFGGETTDTAPSSPGILGPVAGLIGNIQATEVLKYFTSTGRLLVERLLVWDALRPGWDEFSYHRRPDCAACRSG